MSSIGPLRARAPKKLMGGLGQFGCPLLGIMMAVLRAALRNVSNGFMSGLHKSGHSWAIYEYTPFCNGPDEVKSPL
jgi:hypothetical protein